MENEIKLSFPSKEALYAAIREEWFQRAISILEVKDESYDNRYLDTITRDLRETLTTVRVRHVLGKDYIHTVKTGGKSLHNGLSCKYEWNAALETGDFDVDTFISCAGPSEDPVDILEKALAPVRGKELVDLCRTSFTRKTILARFRASEMEICLDIGLCFGLTRSEPICEMEIELISGEVQDIRDFGELVLSSTQATYSTMSKFARCLQLLEEVHHE